MNNNYDVGIIGSGVAGVFAAYKIAQEDKNLKVMLLDLGRPPMKRRRQLEGFLGCLPNSDGKLYLNDFKKVENLAGLRRAKSAYKNVSEYMSSIFSYKTTKSKAISSSLDKKIKKNGFEISLNDYVQVYPKDIHAMSKDIANFLSSCKNFNLNFDNEVFSVIKEKGIFTITTQYGKYSCKKLLVSVGRSGWRWANGFYKSLGIIKNNDYARIGVRMELPESFMKDFNGSSCDLKKDNLYLGPLCWNGSVIPEDHLDTAICSFRSNEDRWHTDKVSFSLISKELFKDNGFEQADRLAKLTFIISNDRILKEKVNLVLNGKSKLSILPEYDWVKNAILDIATIIPEFATKANIHVPNLEPLSAEIELNSNLESTEINNLFIAGESAGITGILSAAISGTIVGKEILK